MDELVGTTVTRTYAYGLSRISENQKIGTTQTASFYGYDGHGNVRFLTGSTGTATDTYVYDAFGLPITTSGTTPNNYLYSGEQFDSALGMYYLRARCYNLATGRFLAMVPYQGDTMNPQTLHKYVYSSNNPVNAADPTGRDIAGYVQNPKDRGSACGRIRCTAGVLCPRRNDSGHRGVRFRVYKGGSRGCHIPWPRPAPP